MHNLIPIFKFRSKTEWTIFLFVIVVIGYFYANGGSSQNSRLDVIYSFVETGFSETNTFKINRFIVSPVRGINTDDWAFNNGNFYSNKAPGTHFLGIPVYFIIFHVQNIFDIDCNNPLVEIFDAYLINLFISIIPLAFAAVLMFRIFSVFFGCPEKKSLMYSLFLVFCTPLFPYSVQIWGHTTAAAFLVFSLYSILNTENKNYFLSGFWIGCATITDYLAGIFAVTIFIYVLTTEKKMIFHYIAGGLAPLLALIAYQYACFGSIVNLSISKTNPLFTEDNKLLGSLGTVSIDIIYRILFSLERGMFLSTPLLLLSAAGFLIWFKTNSKDRLLWLCAGSIILIVVVNSSFNAWHGGASTYMRYQICSIPFWILVLAKIPDGRIWRYTAILLASCSILNMLAIAAVSTECTVPLDSSIDKANFERSASAEKAAPGTVETTRNPLFGWTYGHFLRGELSIFKSPIRYQALNPDWDTIKEYTSWNMGMLLGLKGLWSLAPLLLIVIAFSALFISFYRKIFDT
ncbi:MAG TPA: hypothetical protein DET40_19485 [Lentisphaeria bacterium]|nr:MAG: hypothetical protein A2X45_18315 [Lentisphaerae bacterium GWF2_50_93]HCE45731.1 hypothetical protein [Lentisphaeria bacterium]